jgi:hypothetical protein
VCGGEEKEYGIFLGRSERKRQLGIPRPKWEDNIKIDLREP